jgi:hypothetical protein
MSPKKLPSKAAMMKREKRETRAQEAKESPAYQKREQKLGVEEHALGKKVANQPLGYRG